MPKFILSLFILLMMMSSGCNNPSGGSVIARENAPFLQAPAAFAFSQIRARNGDIEIAWQDSKRAATYEFFMGTSSTTITTPVPACSGIVESCQINGLDPNTTYYFDITARNDAGTKKVTSIGTALSVGLFNISSSTVGDEEIGVTWGASNNATSYNIIYGTQSGFYPNTITNVTSPYTITGLTNGNRYYVRVVAVNNFNGYSASNNEINQQPFGPLPAPTGLTLTATPGQILLDWADSAGATNYKIFKGLTAGSVAEIVNGNVPSTYTDSSTTDGVSYFYAIRAFNGFDSPLSTVATARSISAFNIASAVAGPAPAQVTVTWPDTTGEDAYDILYGSNPAALNLTATGVTSPHIFTGLTGGLPYFFRVVARNAIGLGTTQFSNNQLSATPIASISAPTGLTATSTPSTVNLNWTAVPGATEYRVYRGLTSGSVAFLVGGVPSNNYTDNSVTNGTTYFYSVRAFNGFDSPDSTQVSTRPISGFTFTSATVATFSSADLVWGNATGAATYDIRYGTTSGSYTTTVTNRTSPTTLTGLSASTTYFMVIRANNLVGTGTSVTSNELTFTTGTLFPTVSITTFPLINNANRTSYTVSGACSENGRIVTVSVGGVTSTPTCTALAWSATLNATAAADSATLSITANHLNSGGNAANASRSVIKDTINPTVAITSSPAINNTNEAAYTVSGTCSENTRTVSVIFGGITASPVCTSLAWSTTLNTTALGDGPVSITADLNDAAGNTATQATASITKDTIIPSVAITSSPVINNANRTAYTVSGTCSETGRMVNVMVGSTSGSNTCTLLTWSVTLNVSGNADSGTVVVTADHTDAASNPAVQAGTSVLKDTVNPTVAITVFPLINNANRNAYTFSGTCSENTRTVSVSVGGITGTSTCTSLAWSSTLDVSALADGPSIALTADHTDSAGNNATQATRSVLKNTALPTVAITSSTTINNANRTAYVVTGTCSESTRIVTVNVGGVTGTPTCTSNAWTSTLNVNAVADNASVAITANHSDSIGNNAIQASINVLKDTIIPTVAITSSPVINNANRTAYVVSGTCSENTRDVSVSVGGVTSTQVCTSSAWTATLNVTAVADGASVSVTANHTDAALNNATQASATVVKDTANPTVAISSSTAINIANRNAYPVNGTCSENTRTVTVTVGGVSETLTCTALAWSTTMNVSLIADNGFVGVTADHTDASGNNAVQATITVVKDTSNPTVAITSSPVINNANKNSFTVSGTCSESGRNVTVNVGSVNTTSLCSLLTWSATVNISGNPDSATLLITADHSDAAGNNAVQAGTTVIKDTANPTVTIGASPTINNANETSYTVSGACSENTRQVSINVGGVASNPVCTSLAWSTTVNVSSVADSASISITANHTDSAGNTATQASATVIKDTTNSTVAITSSPLINNANKAAYVISGTCSENSRIVSVNVGGATSTPTCSALVWTTTLDVTGVTDSTSVLISADHVDASGNAATQATTTVLKDTINPTVAISSSPGINNVNKASYNLTGTCSENAQIVSVNVGGVTANPICTTLTWSATLNVTGVADSASVSINVGHSDAAGNSAIPSSVTVAKDTTNPSVAITSAPTINNANRLGYVVSGTCSENTRSVSVNVGGVTASPTCTTLTWSTIVNLTGVADGGAIAITADHTDASGNAATQATTTVLKDTINPTVEITSSPIINNANKAAYVVSGNCSDNTRTVTVSVGGVSSTPACTTLTWTATIDVTTVLDGGAVSITANHTDIAANPATQASTTVLKDTSNPTVAITSSPAINSTNNSAYPVSGTCSENSRIVSVSVGGVIATPTCTSLSWTATLNVVGVTDGLSVPITADHTDAVLNSATQASTTVVKNTDLPTTSITSAPAINNTNKASYTVSGACSENTRTVSVSVGGVSGTPTCTALAWSTTLNVTGVADSPTVSVTADHSDGFGNNAIQATTNVLKDTFIPTVTISTAPAINNINRVAYPVTGTCSENTRTVTVNVGGVSASPTCTALAWSASLNVTTVADGASISVTANHSDAALNNAVQASTTVLKDTGNPTVAISSAPAINNANRAAYVISGTCSENTRPVTVSVGGVSGTPTCTTLAWSTTLNVTGVADSATVAVTADHTDASGNAATQATATIIKDTVNPTVAITSSPVIFNGNRTAYTVSGTCSENTRTVSVNVGGVTGTPTCTALAWSTILNVTGVADSGSVSITADHTDAVLNNATQATTSVIKDTTNPTVAITSSPAINNTNRTAYPVSGTCSENTRTVTVNVGGVTGTPTCTALAWSTTLNVTAVADNAAVSVTADHTDVNGNSAAQASTTVLKDTTAPTVAITSSPAINLANRAAYVVSGTCSENTRTVLVSVGGVTSTPTCTTLAWSATLNVTGVTDSASVAVTADHSDASGNFAVQASTTILKDVIIPTVAITSSPAINNANRTAYPISGTCSENTRTVSVSVGGVSSSPTCTALAWTATLNVTGVTDGASIAVTADHTDAALNNATQATTTVSKDTSNPTVAITSSPLINNANRTSYTVSGSCSENTRTVTVSVGGVSGTPTCTALAWSTTLNVTGVADSASVAVTADHSDAAGNNATQATTAVVKDTSNPTVAITSAPIINFANRAAYPVSGTCSENTRLVSVNVGGVAATPTCTALSWSTSVNVTGVADGASISITADHTDAVGNTATQASTTVLKDTVIPTVAITFSPLINSANQAAYVVSGTCSENTRIVSVNVGGVTSTPTCTILTWSATLNVTSVPDGGSVSITANHTDAAANAATQASTTVIKDANLPSVAITSSPAITNTNRAAYTVSGTCSENTRTVSVLVGGVAGTPTCTALAWSTTLNVTAVPDGVSVAITANHSDSNSNNAPQASTTVVKDTVIPTVAITSSPAINNANRAAYTVTGTCSENTRTVSVNVGGVTSSPTCTALAWSATLNVTAVVDSASVSITANHTDAVGNAATQASTTVTKDTSNPTVAITSSPVINNVNKSSYTVSGTCSDTGRTVTINVGSVSTSDTCTLLTWTATVDVSGNPDSATLLITADHSDASGNNAVQAGTTVLKDTVIPTVAISTAPLINNANRTAYTVTGTCSENTRVVSVNIGGVTATPTCSAGTWTTGAINVTAAADSVTLSITANHTDSAANPATQASTTVIKDTVNPLVAITSSPTINIANQTAYTVSGTCSENTRTVVVSIGGVSATPTCSGGTWSTVPINVSAAIDSLTLSITANHNDVNANSATQASASVLKDTITPSVALSTTEPASTSNSTWIIRATFSEAVTGVAIGDFVVSNGTASAFTTISSSIYEITLTPTANGTVTVDMASASAADNAGNPNSLAAQLSRTYVPAAVLTFAVTTTHNFGSVNIGASADVTLLINKSGTPNATAVTEIGLAAPFAFKGGAFPGTGGTCTTTITGSCSVVVTYSPTTAAVHNDTIQLQYNNGSTLTSVSRNLTGTGTSLVATNTRIDGPSGIMINQCIPYTIYSTTSTGALANVTANQTVNLVINNATNTNFFTTAACATIATSTIITANTNSRVVWLRSTTTAQNITLVANPTTLVSSTLDVTTGNTPTAISFTTPLEMKTNLCVPIKIDLVDALGNEVGKSTAVQVNLGKTGSAVFYSDVNCTGVITSKQFPAFSETQTVYVKDSVIESVNFSFTDQAAILATDTSTVNFVAAQLWWNNAYLKRMPITLNNQDQAAAHTNIPVLVRLNSSIISYSDTRANGADIRFTLDNHATTLDYEIESWNAAGDSLVWVRIPSIAASANRVIYMYYNNTAAADGQNASGTWTGFSGIWNMKKSGANYIDSTGSGKTGVAVGVLTDVNGPSGNAITTNGSSSLDVSYDLSQIIGLTSTVSLWMRSTQTGNNTAYLAPGITGVEKNGDANDIFFGWISGTGTIRVSAGDAVSAQSNFVVNDGTWRFVTMSREQVSGAVKFYVNGVLNGTGTSSPGAKTTAFSKFGLIGNTAGAPKYFIGSMDGIRLINSIQTDARIKAEYKFATQNNISYGTSEDF